MNSKNTTAGPAGFDGLELKHFVSAGMGLVLQAPKNWIDTGDQRNFQAQEPDTATVITASSPSMASGLRFFFRACASMLLLWHLTGCGNAYENIEIGEWESAGEVTASPEVPLSPEVFRMAVMDRGRGREIRAGSLVQIRLAAGSGLLKDAATRKPLQNATAWLWIGKVPADGARKIGDFGLAQLRAAMVGLGQGARLSVFADPQRAGLVLSVPARGFLLPFAYRPAGEAADSLDTEYIELAGKGDYAVEIVRVCVGRLLRKEALLRQWGYVFNWGGDTHHQFARQGVLEWLAIEADCEEPNEKVRLEKGPAYGIGTPGYRESPLLSWQASYEAAR